MNRYVLAGLLAALVALLGNGIDTVGRLFSGEPGRSRSQERAAAAEVGTTPIEQAGRVVQRQNQAAIAAPNATFQERSGIPPTLAPQTVPTTELSPETTNVIPRTGVAPQTTTTRGDIAPIQPGLVQPGSPGGGEFDQDLDSIPALW